jgi:hypothetical protein
MVEQYYRKREENKGDDTGDQISKRLAWEQGETESKPASVGATLSEQKNASGGKALLWLLSYSLIL